MGKATGLDNISNELLKTAGPACSDFLHALFNSIYSQSQFPEGWKTAYITTLHKKRPKQDPVLQSQTGHRIRPTHPNPQRTTNLQILQRNPIGDEYHSFQCPKNLDLQVYCGINVTSRPQFHQLMENFPTNVQRYINLLMSRIKNQ